jgi:hypothetical protein
MTPKRNRKGGFNPLKKSRPKAKPKTSLLRKKEAYKGGTSAKSRVSVLDFGDLSHTTPENAIFATAHLHHLKEEHIDHDKLRSLDRYSELGSCSKVVKRLPNDNVAVLPPKKSHVTKTLNEDPVGDTSRLTRSRSKRISMRSTDTKIDLEEQDMEQSQGFVNGSSISPPLGVVDVDRSKSIAKGKVQTRNCCSQKKLNPGNIRNESLIGKNGNKKGSIQTTLHSFAMQHVKRKTTGSQSVPLQAKQSDKNLDKSIPRETLLNFSDSSDENSSRQTGHLPSRFTRLSAIKASQRITCMIEENQDIPFSFKENKFADEDDSFESEDASDSTDESSIDESSVVENGDNDEILSNNKNVLNVDEDENFLDHDDSDESVTNSSSKNLEVQAFDQMKCEPIYPEPMDDTCFDATKRKKGQDGVLANRLSNSVLFSPHMPFCSSTVDAITMEPIPEKHICFFMPDKKTKQCFALGTLRKIALIDPIVDTNEKPVFKQPPHFRSPMSADIIDQIASRFGRGAVDLNGSFYNSTYLESDYELSVQDIDEENFTERVKKYVNKCMGGRDIYCCPVCYSEAHRRLENNEVDNIIDDDSSDEDIENVNLEFIADPMTILGFVDDHEFKLASTFCFLKLTQLKQHLMNEHDVDPKIVHGNDLYKRFQIRASDGLLQRFLEKKSHKNKAIRHVSRQGAMVHYWHQGNNEIFVYLLDLIDQWNEAKNIFDGSCVEEALDDENLDEFVVLCNEAKSFWSSFSFRGKRLWEVISEPYQKETKEELDDFIAHGDGEDEEFPGEAINYRLINKEMDDEEDSEDDIIHEISKKYVEKVHNLNLEEDSDDEEEDGDECPLNSSSDEFDHKYYSEESEPDEWQQEVMRKRKARVKESKLRRSVIQLALAKSPKVITKRKGSMGSDIIDDKKNSSLQFRKRRIIQVSDSD